MSSRRAAAVALFAGCLLASCGVPAQDDPHRVELPRRPFTTPAPAAVTTDEAGDVAEVLCLTRQGRLVQVVRRISALPSPQRQIEHLMAGPTAAERDNGLTSTLAGMSLAVAVPAGGFHAEVEVTLADEGSARSDEVLVFGQIVCTLTSRADVSSVSFVRDDLRLDVPRADGSLTQERLRADDYSSLIGPA
jgi:hypothetical protein